jgi:hypothetical protein
MLKKAWRFLVGAPEISERALLLEAIKALKEQSVEQNKTFQQWLGMFAGQAGQKPQGWTADDDALAIKEAAAARNLMVPQELLQRAMDEDI